jgi:hypothetical protein
MALGEDEAIDRAIDEATRSNWRVRQARGIRPKVRPAYAPGWWLVTLWVTELPH